MATTTLAWHKARLVMIRVANSVVLKILCGWVGVIRNKVINKFIPYVQY